MDWGMLFAIVAFAALLQLTFFWYYLRAGQRHDSVYPSATSESSDNPGFSAGSQSSNTQGSGDELHVTCSSCGFDNAWDSTFTYCANCVEKLG